MQDTDLSSTASPFGSKGLTDTEYKDTVLFLQQQQALHHQEIMSAIGDLRKQIGSSPRSATVVNGARFIDESGSSAATILAMPSPHRPTALQLRDAELDAARSRIAELETQVKSLTLQLESKELTIQRLSAAAVRDAEIRVASGAGTSAQPGSTCRATLQHRDIVEVIGSLASVPTRTKDVRDVLRLHDQRCQQLVNSSPSL